MLSDLAKVEAGRLQRAHPRRPSTDVCNAKASDVDGDGRVDKVASELCVEPVVVVQAWKRKLAIAD